MIAFAPYVLVVASLVVLQLQARAADARQERQESTQTAERLAWTHERQELLNRLQAPGFVPVGVPGMAPPVEHEPPETDEWDLVGQVLTAGELDA